MTLHPLDRRSALRASAWALPAVALSTAAPAFASSGDQGPLLEHLGDVNGRWTLLRITNRSSQPLVATFSVDPSPIDGDDYVWLETMQDIFTYYTGFSSDANYYHYSLNIPAKAALDFRIGWYNARSTPGTTTLVLTSTGWPDVLLPIALPG